MREPLFCVAPIGKSPAECPDWHWLSLWCSLLTKLEGEGRHLIHFHTTVEGKALINSHAQLRGFSRTSLPHCPIWQVFRQMPRLALVRPVVLPTLTHMTASKAKSSSHPVILNLLSNWPKRGRHVPLLSTYPGRGLETHRAATTVRPLQLEQYVCQRSNRAN